MKKLLLTLGAVASVAAPVAAVVACGSTPTTTNTDTFAEANTKIAAVISGIADTAFATPIEAKAPMWDAVTKESEMNREIKIVNSGFEVTLENKNGTKLDAFFATKAEIQTQIDKSLEDEIAFEKSQNVLEAFSKTWTKKTITEISTPMVVYSDSVSNGFKEVYTSADFATQSFLDFDADAFTAINTIITDALAPKPTVAPKAAAVSGTTEIVTGLEQTAFDALTDDTFNLISDEAALAKALGLTTLPTELSLTGAPSIHFDSATKVLKLTSGLKGETLFTLKVKA